ncbi:MAG: FIST C-terminal domain-containing protein [Candidatus Omnitrophota bacterium]
MKEDTVAVAASINPSGVEAIKEITSKVKLTTKNKPVYLVLVFFTPDYNPYSIKETIDITLRPEKIFGIQSPMVICQDKVLKKGVVLCCLASDNLSATDIFLEGGSCEEMESLLRKSLLSIKKGEKIVISVLGPQTNPHNYIRTAELSLGRNTKVFGAGFIKKYGAKNFQINNTTVDEGTGNLLLSGPFTAVYEKTGGFLPLGGTFTITKVSPEKNVISEIDDKPAAHIYKKYLENKFDLFQRTSLVSFYPIGIKENNEYKLVNVIDFLGDDSLICLGDIKEGAEAKIMMANSATMAESFRKFSRQIEKRRGWNMAIIINSVMRRNILKQESEKEVKEIKRILGEKTDVIGFYSDYNIFPGENTGKFSIENNHLCMVSLKYETL